MNPEKISLVKNIDICDEENYLKDEAFIDVSRYRIDKSILPREIGSLKGQRILQMMGYEVRCINCNEEIPNNYVYFLYQISDNFLTFCSSKCLETFDKNDELKATYLL